MANEEDLEIVEEEGDDSFPGMNDPGVIGDFHGLEEETEPPGTVQEERIVGGVRMRHIDEQDARELFDASALIPNARWDVFEDFLDMIAELERHPKVHDVSVETHRPVSELMCLMLQDGLESPIPEEVLGYYRVSDGFSLTWSFEAPNGQMLPMGKIELLSLGRVFGSWLEKIWKEWDHMSAEALDLIWTLRGWDGPEEGDDWIVALGADEHGEYQLYWHHNEHGTYELDMALEDYVHWAIAARGIRGWQFLRSNYDFVQDPLELDGMAVFFDVMNTLFPDEDLSYFRDRLEPHEDEEE